MSDSAPRSTHAHPVWWVIALSLAAIATNLWTGGAGAPMPALAQAVGGGGAAGVFAFSGQLTPNTFGIFMVDVDAGTLWCYEYTGVGGAKKLRLAAARHWLFDRYLEDFQNDGLSPSEVEALVVEQRARRKPPVIGNQTP